MRWETPVVFHIRVHRSSTGDLLGHLRSLHPEWLLEERADDLIVGSTQLAASRWQAHARVQRELIRDLGHYLDVCDITVMGDSRSHAAHYEVLSIDKARARPGNAATRGGSADVGITFVTADPEIDLGGVCERISLSVGAPLPPHQSVRRAPAPSRVEATTNADLAENYGWVALGAAVLAAALVALYFTTPADPGTKDAAFLAAGGVLVGVPGCLLLWKHYRPRLLLPAVAAVLGGLLAAGPWQELRGSIVYATAVDFPYQELTISPGLQTLDWVMPSFTAVALLAGALGLLGYLSYFSPTVIPGPAMGLLCGIVLAVGMLVGLAAASVAIHTDVEAVRREIRRGEYLGPQGVQLRRVCVLPLAETPAWHGPVPDPTHVFATARFTGDRVWLYDVEQTPGPTQWPQATSVPHDQVQLVPANPTRRTCP